MGTTRRPRLARRAVGVTSAFALSLGALPLMATPAAAASLIDIGAACDNAPPSTLNDANSTPTSSGDSNWQDVIDCLSAANGYEGEDGSAVLSGNNEGNANFAALVTRAQFAGIFSRIIEAAGLATDENASTPFTDIDGAFFEGAIRAMYGQGLTTGKTATTYDTQSGLIMGQLATFYVGLIEKVTGESLVADGTSNVHSNYGVHSANAEKLFDNGFLTDAQAADGTGSVLRGDIFAMAARAISHLVAEGILTNPFFACDIEVESAASQAECDALLALYSTTDGPNWFNNDGWATSADPCTWFGVVCDVAGVVELDLTDNDLVGPISPAIGNLASLEGLLLSDNQLTSVPAKIGGLTSLLGLALDGNELTTLPAEIGNLAALEVLVLDGNELTTLPAEIGDLTSLILLSLTGNRLTTVPTEIGNLSSLLLLWLDGNRLTTVPAEIGDLTSLVGLWLDGNQLTTLPSQLGNLSSLDELWVSDNLLTGNISGWATPLAGHDTITLLAIWDDGGGNDCLTVDAPATEAWLTDLDPGWDDCTS